MTVDRRTNVTAIVSIAVLMLAGLQDTTGAQRPNVSPASVREVHELLLAAYPELHRQSVEWRTDVTDDGVRVRALPERPAFRAADAAEPVALLAADISFDQRGRLRKLEASGPLVRVTRATAATAAAAPVDAAAASVADMVPAGVRRLFGEPDGAPLEPTLDPETKTATLRITLVKVGDDGVSQSTTLVIEPNAGRLIGVVRP
jgi:hypothetical protein